MKITTVGIDLAKNVFQIHAVNEHGKTVLKKQLKRDQLAAFFVNVCERVNVRRVRSKCATQHANTKEVNKPCATLMKMRAGPSESASRCWLQTTSSCVG